MTRLLLPLLLASLFADARELSELTPYLDLNTTDRFVSLVTTEEDANARRDDNNKSILMYAVWIGNDAAVTHLIAKGADVNAKDAEGITPLLLAIYKERTAIALRLIAAGSDVNASANDGMTPLMLSRFKGNKSVEDAILDHNKEPE